MIATLKKVFQIVSGGKKKMKTIISFNKTNFQSYTEVVNDSNELVISGLDGNGVVFSQTLAIQSFPVILAYSPAQVGFQVFNTLGEMGDEYQVHKVIRTIA